MSSARKAVALDVVAVDTLADLAPHEEEWDALADRCAGRGFMAGTYPWFAAYAEHRLEGASWTCLLARAGDDLVAALPLVRRPHALFRGLRPWMCVPNDVHTNGGTGLFDPGHVKTALPALIDAAFALRPRPIGLRFGGLVSPSPTLDALEQRPDGRTAADGTSGRALVLTGDFAACFAALGSNLRRNLRKARNRLDRLGTVAYRRGADTEPLPGFLDLEASGWKGRSGGAVRCSPALTAFYERLCGHLAARDRLAWHVLELDGRSLAGALVLRYGAQVVLLRVAHDDAHARHSPGQLLMAEMLRTWHEDGGIECVDCLTDQPWHRTWHMDAAPYHEGRIRAPGLVPFLAGELPARLRARLKEIRVLRRWVRRLRGEDDR